MLNRRTTLIAILTIFATIVLAPTVKANLVSLSSLYVGTQAGDIIRLDQSLNVLGSINQGAGNGPAVIVGGQDGTIYHTSNSGFINRREASLGLLNSTSAGCATCVHTKMIQLSNGNIIHDQRDTSTNAAGYLARNSDLGYISDDGVVGSTLGPVLHELSNGNFLSQLNDRMFERQNDFTHVKDEGDNGSAGHAANLSDGNAVWDANVVNDTYHGVIVRSPGGMGYITDNASPGTPVVQNVIGLSNGRLVESRGVNYQVRANGNVGGAPIVECPTSNCNGTPAMIEHSSGVFIYGANVPGHNDGFTGLGIRDIDTWGLLGDNVENLGGDRSIEYLLELPNGNVVYNEGTKLLVYDISNPDLPAALFTYEVGSDITALTVATALVPAVPEPATVTLMGIGGLAMLRRRRAA